MLDLISSVAILAIMFSVTNILLNVYLLISIFWFKKVPIKRSFALIYCKFIVDVCYSTDTSTFLVYYFIRIMNPTIFLQNLVSFIALPNSTLSTIRCWFAFFIALDRVWATCLPIFYHKHRLKVSLSALILFILSYSVFEYYFHFVLCGFVLLDVPSDCILFRCAVGTCYYEYWKLYEQIMYSSIGALSVFLSFRLFIWNSLSGSSNNRAISRATRISLIDSFINFAFHFLPVFLSSQWPNFNTNTVGPFGSLSKSLGFVIESTMICHVLLGQKKVRPVSLSKTSPPNMAGIRNPIVVT